MTIIIAILWVLPGIDKLRINEWYQTIPELWRRILTILFDLFFTPMGIVLDLIRSFGSINIK